MVKLQLFGGLTLHDRSGPMEGRIVQKRRLALLALLANADSQGVSRERIAAYFWPDHSTAQARRRVADALYVIRQELGQDVLSVRGDHVYLSTEVVESDVAGVRDALKHNKADRVLDGAGGRFLEGFHLPDAAAFMLWVDTERQRWQQQIITCLLTAAEALMAGGQTAQARPYCERVVLLDPYDARAMAMLLRVLQADGQTGAAIQAGEQFQERLQEELELSPAAAVAEALSELRQRPATAYQSHSSLVSSSATPHRISPLADDVPSRVPRAKWNPLWLGMGSIAVFAALVFGVWVFVQPARVASAERTNSVVVFPFVNHTGNEALASVGAMTTDGLLRGFVQVPELVAMDGRFSQSEAETPNTLAHAQTVAQDLAAKTLVWGTYYQEQDSLFLQANLMQLPDGEVLHTLTEGTTLQTPMRAVEQLRTRVTGALATLFDTRINDLVAQAAHLPDFDTYRRFVVAQAHVWRAEYEEALPLLEAVVQADSAFVPAKVYLTYAYGYIGHGANTDALIAELQKGYWKLSPLEQAHVDRLEGYNTVNPRQIFEASKRIQTLTPRSERGAWFVAASATINGAFDEGLPHFRFLAQQEGAITASPRFWSLYTRTLYSLGMYDEARSVAEQALNQFPNHLRITGDLIRVQVAVEDVEGVRQRMAEILQAWQSAEHFLPLDLVILAGRELMVHGYPGVAREVFNTMLTRVDGESFETLSLPDQRAVGYALYYVQAFDQADQIFQVLLDQFPDSPSYLSLHGMIAARQENWEHADGVAVRLRDLPNTAMDDGSRFYEARLAVLRGDEEHAVTLIQQSLQEYGYSFILTPANDPDFLSLHENPEFQTLWSLTQSL